MKKMLLLKKKHSCCFHALLIFILKQYLKILSKESKRKFRLMNNEEGSYNDSVG